MMNPDMNGLSPIIPMPMSYSVVSDQSFYREGSLPFKKRKLYRAGSGSASVSSQEDQKLPYATSLSVSCGSDDEKIAALALIAAASSALPIATNSAYPGLLLSPSVINEHNQRMHVIQDEPKRNSPIPQTSEVPQETVPVDTIKPKLRVHHPPLRSPLPGGCHGRTARNNSYCRRHPCYNGSKYCKLHYQMHIVNGMRPDDINKSIAESGEQSPAAIAPAQTDKRFQGLDGEGQCTATTTRGRTCSYVRVNNTRYCFLHADYDSNPPPRRGGGTTSATKERTISVSSSVAESSSSGDDYSVASHGETLTRTPSKPPAPVTSEESSDSPALVTPQSSSVTEATTPPSKKNITTRDGKPLLSSLSYDQWLNKKVKIATGPLTNQTGRVVKWGNGWVGVRVAHDDSKGQDDDRLLHNRRAVELFLLQGESGDEHETSTEVENVQETAGATSPLLRCVSQEIDAQVLDTAGLVSRKEAASPSELSSSHVDPSDTAQVASESAMGGKGDSATSESNGDKQIKLNVSYTKASDKGLASPSSVKSINESSKNHSPPLVESLMRAQEQGLRKLGLGLLFGTAALERGRRKIHSPSRYEDTAMIEKGKYRQSSEGHLSFRKGTPVSSPRGSNLSDDGK